MNALWLSRHLPGLVCMVAALYLVVMAAPPRDRDGQMNIHEFGKIPVEDHGRTKPLDSVARTTLVILSGKQTFKDEKDKEQPAIKWLLDVMSRQGKTEKYKVFRIYDEEVLGLLGLKPRKGFRYAIDEFQDKLAKLFEHAGRADEKPRKERDRFDNAVLQTAGHIKLYLDLGRFVTPSTIPPKSEGNEWRTLAEVASEVRPMVAQKVIEAIKKEAAGRGIDLEKMSEDDYRKFVEPELERTYAAISPFTHGLESILRHYAAGDVNKFNKAVESYGQLVNREIPATAAHARFETFFNHFAPFYHSAVLYVIVFLLACVSWLSWGQPLNRSAFWLAVLILIVHSLALLGRMYLMNRWFVFVTNLYSSAIFIGWGCVILGLVLELIYRNGLGNVITGVAGSVTLLIAHHGLADGDTLEALLPVLDTNFWLATHVTCVTTGYAATFVSGLLGTIFVLLGVFTYALNRDLMQNLVRMIYGVVCFATLFSFTGTVLGGIWADQSWGRFWGWDPKENGALIIVIWNALILHARWGGMVKQRGMAVLAILGNVVTAWSWFGVNMLGVGLHSYGFMEGALFWLVAFVFSQMILVGVGLVPTTKWRSFGQAFPGAPA